MNLRRLLVLAAATLLLAGPTAGARPQAASSKDWPMWRHDAGHMGATPRRCPTG